MAGKFEIKSGKTGKFRFNLKASNGQVILSSEAYNTAAAAKSGAASVAKNAGNAKRFERKKAKDGSPYFVMKAANGEVIGKSEMYKTAKAMENGIASVAKHAPGAAIVSGDAKPAAKPAAKKPAAKKPAAKKPAAKKAPAKKAAAKKPAAKPAAKKAPAKKAAAKKPAAKPAAKKAPAKKAAARKPAAKKPAAKKK